MWRQIYGDTEIVTEEKLGRENDEDWGGMVQLDNLKHNSNNFVGSGVRLIEIG